MPQLERLGQVTIPSGRLLVVDTGLLNLWCHDEAPLLPEGELSSPEATEAANRSQDFRIEGRDAARAAELFDRQPQRRWLFDIPPHGVATIERAFADLVRQHGLDARLVPASPRLTHLRRAREAITDGPGGFLMHGVPLVACGGLPAHSLDVVGERRGAEPWPNCWSWVGVQVCDHAVAMEQRVGDVGVDWARLMFVDVEALAHWNHHDPLDGRADFVFWGRDAAAAAKRFGAQPLEEGHFGFVDLPIDDVIARCMPIEEARERGEYRMATDFRPHTQHYRLLEQMRPSPTESGTLALGASQCCAFFTTWGDGIFPVFRDVDAEGRLVRIRVQLGTALAIRNMDRVNGITAR